MRQSLLVFSIALAGMTAVACDDDDVTTVPVSKVVNFTATLRGSNEVPANTSAGTGTITASLDTSTNVFTWNVTVSGLSANINNGHIHGPAAAGVNAGVILNFNPATNQIAGSTFTGFGTATAGTAAGTITLGSNAITATVTGDSLKKLILAGLTYVNIHTTAIPAGEIRAQLVRQ
jgi:hypothetical protein